MMLYPAMHKLLEKIPNRYLLVNIVAKRARDLGDIAEQTGERYEEKTVSMALQDVITERVHVASGDEVND